MGDGAGRSDARGTQAVGTACEGAGACASGFCVDGRCCQSACAGVCERCDLAGALGTCTAIPEGQDPAAECAGTDAPCAGTCDGARRCRFDPTKVCDGACRTDPATGDTQALTFRCSDDGRCNKATAATTKRCAFSRCTGSGLSANCPTTCATAADCLPTSLCDRAEAHASGRGTCVDPKDILRLTDPTTDANLNTAFGQLSATKPVLGLRPGTYTLGATLAAGKRALLIGLGAKPDDVILRPSAAPTIDVGTNATLQLQNLAIVRPLGSPVVGNALTCDADATHRSSVTLLETTLSGHTGKGLESSYCDVTVRRSTLHANDGGGLALANGRFIVSDTLLYGNGTAGAGGSTTGGVSFASATGVTFLNNTVVSNLAADGTAAGVLCSTATTQLVNSLVAANSLNVALCTVAPSSLVAGTLGDACALTAFKPTTGVCLNDKGDNAAVAQSRLDHDNAPRIKGTKVDLGAFEVQ
ncbi:MAG: right-handed parallel beta-helix repeat-containing protein [Proteobacteria bacterium]|nr:right-handed parallel beta-helix repeat-containing protein [Pseudomonadota bacterium]